MIRERLNMERGVVWQNQWSSVCVCVCVSTDLHKALCIEKHIAGLKEGRGGRGEEGG